MATILIAEDERDIRELIGMTLTFGGHKVFKAANGAEAVEMAPTVMPDLIMMDVRMPRMTGFEACMQLKTMDSVKHIPVVFLSAKGQEAEIESGLEAGAYDFILKPFSPADLIVRINQILAATPKPEVKNDAPAPASTGSAEPDPAAKIVEGAPAAPDPAAAPPAQADSPPTIVIGVEAAPGAPVAVGQTITPEPDPPPATDSESAQAAPEQPGTL